MTKKLNIRDFIDDIAEESFSSSKSPLKDEDYLLACSSDGEEEDEDEDDSNNNILTEKSLDTNDNNQKGRSHYINQSIKDDEKEIKAILERNFKRSKRVDPDTDTDIIIQPKKGGKVSLKLPQKTIDMGQPKKFQLGFKRKQFPPTPPATSIDNINKGPLKSPDSNNDILMSLKYSHEKRIKKMLNENSDDFNHAFKERIKEDEAILKNVVKKNDRHKKNDIGNKSLFHHQLKANKSSSFLHSIKETK